MAESVPRIEEAKESVWSDESDSERRSSGNKKKKRGQREGSSRFKEEERDPLVAIMMNEEVVKVCSTLIAKLELIRFDEDRKTVFKTSWAQGLFHTCVKRLAPGVMDDFDIQRWYNDVIQDNEGSAAGRGRRKTNYGISPTTAVQAVQTNWLTPLFEIEIKAPGFIRLFYNHLELEDSTHKKMATGAKEDTEYSHWLSMGSMSRAAPLCLTSGGEPAKKLLTGK